MSTIEILAEAATVNDERWAVEQETRRDVEYALAGMGFNFTEHGWLFMVARRRGQCVFPVPDRGEITVYYRLGRYSF